MPFSLGEFIGLVERSARTQFEMLKLVNFSNLNCFERDNAQIINTPNK